MRRAWTVGLVWGWAALARAASPASVDVQTSPNEVVANFADTATVHAVVLDANGQPMANQPVVVSCSGSNNGLSRRSGLTDGQGAFDTALKSNVAQVKLVTVIAGEASAYAAVRFVAGPANVSRSSVTATPKVGLLADGLSQSLVTVTVADVFANPIDNARVRLSVSGSNNVLSQAEGDTSDAGLLLSTLSSTTAESKTVSAQVGTVTVSTQVAFVGNSPNATFSALTIEPNGPVAADQNESYLLRVALRDDYNNAIPDFPVAFGINGKTARFDANDGYSSKAGTFQTLLRSSSTGNKVVHVISGAFATERTVAFVVGQPRSGTSTVVASPSRLVADNNATTTLTATIRDASGNPIANANITLAVDGNRNTLSQSRGSTDANGNFTATLSSSAAETKTANVSAGGANARGSVTFLAGAPNASLSRLTINPNTPVAANNSALFTVVASVVDDFGNPLRLFPVSFAASGQNDLLSETATQTSTSGVAYSTVRSTSVGDSRISVTAGNVTLAGNATFSLGALSPLSSRFVASPNANVVADGNQAVTLSVIMRDIVGHTLGNQNLLIVSGGTGDVIDQANGVTDANGLFTTKMTSTRSGTKTLTLVKDAVKVATQVVFVPGPPSQSVSHVSLAPNNVFADSRSITSVETAVLDAYGNACKNVPVVLTVSDSNSIFAKASGTTNMAGLMTTTLRSTLASAKTVSASVDGKFSVSGNVTFIAGFASASTSSLTVSPNSGLLANNNDTATISVSLKDAFGNATPNVRVLLSGLAVGNTFAPGIGLTDANGTFTSSVRSARAAAQKVLLSAGTATLSANVTFSPGPADANTSLLERSPYAGVTANGSSIATVQATVRDAWQNPIAGVPATMQSSNGNDVLSATSGNTTAQGLYVSTVKARQAGSHTLTFQAGGLTLTQAVPFVAGPPVAANSSLTTDVQQAPADNASDVQVTATFVDANGNPASGQWVNFNATGNRYQFSPSGGQTDEHGAIGATFHSAQAGVRVLKAQLGTFAIAGNVTLTAGSPNSNTTKVTATPSSNVPANGTAQVTLQALVFDVFSNPIAGQSVALASNGNTDQIAAPNGTTDANGTYQTTLTSRDAGQKTITLTAGPATATTKVIHVAATSRLQAEPAPLGWARLEGPPAGRPEAWVASCRPASPAPAAVVAAFGGEHEGSVFAWQAGPGGTWHERGGWQGPGPLGGLALGDVDADGIDDVVAADGQGARLVLLHGRDDGRLAAPQALPWASDGGPPRLVDWDADGRPELLLLAPGGQRLQVVGSDDAGRWHARAALPLPFVAKEWTASAHEAGRGAVVAIRGERGAAISRPTPESPLPAWQSDAAFSVTGLWLADDDGDGRLDVLGLSAAGPPVLRRWRSTAQALEPMEGEVALPPAAAWIACGTASPESPAPWAVAAATGEAWRWQPEEGELVPLDAPAAEGLRYVALDGGALELVTYDVADRGPRTLTR